MDNIYKQVSDGIIPTDPETIDKINEFLTKFPQTQPTKPSMKWTDISVNILFSRTIQTAIDIINDVSDIISNRNLVTNADMRRNVFQAFTKSERRLYVGFWLIFLSFILYFIDSAA